LSPDERTEAEVRADRALRRGELSTALSLYQAIATAFPTDEVVQLKVRRIRENLQPMELSHAKTRVPLDQSPPPTNSIQSAEALAARGDYAGAIALYRKALEKRPDSDLIRERLAELFQIAQSMAPRPSPAQPSAKSAPPAVAVPLPPQPPPHALTGSPPHALTGSPPRAVTGSPLARSPGRPLARSPGRPSPGHRVAPSRGHRVAPSPPHRVAPSPGEGPVSTARLLSDLLDQISRRRRSLAPKT